MNPPLAFADALTQLKLLTSQTANFTFTDDELTQALQTAWNDTYVCIPVTKEVDFVSGVWQYAIPTGMTTVTGIRFLRSADDFPEPVAKELWSVNPATNSVEFSLIARNYFQDAYTVYYDGRYKLQTTDNLTTDALVNYVLANAAYILLRNLFLKRSFVFLRNDTSMSDIVNARRDMQGDMLRYKQALQRSFEAI